MGSEFCTFFAIWKVKYDSFDDIVIIFTILNDFFPVMKQVKNLPVWNYFFRLIVNNAGYFNFRGNLIFFYKNLYLFKMRS